MKVDPTEIKQESYQLADGRRLYRMTHIPTGMSVEEFDSSDIAVVERWQNLLDILARRIEAQGRENR